MVAEYTVRGSSFEADKPRPWSSRTLLPGTFPRLSFDIAPDGQHFAAFISPDSTSDQKGSVHVTVLLNFFDELRRRIPVK